MSGEVIPFHGWGLWVIGVAIIVSVVAFVYCLKNAEKLNKLFDKIIDKLVSKFKNKKITRSKWVGENFLFYKF